MDDPALTRDPVAAPLAPPPAAERPLARASALPWLLFLLAVAALAWLAWHVYGPSSRGDPSGISAATLQKQNRLVVLTARLQTVSVKTDKSWWDWLNTSQIAVISAQVNYYLDLAKIDKNRLAWNPDTKTLGVQLPNIRVGEPSLDVEHARFFRQGVWITGASQEKLYRQNAQEARKQATKAATSAFYVAMARESARAAIKQNLTTPLQVAGYGDVTVKVRFDGETAPR